MLICMQGRLDVPLGHLILKEKVACLIVWLIEVRSLGLGFHPTSASPMLCMFSWMLNNNIGLSSNFP